MGILFISRAHITTSGVVIVSKGSKTRPSGNGLPESHKEMIALHSDLFWEKDVTKKEQIKLKIEKLKGELHDL